MFAKLVTTRNKMFMQFIRRCYIVSWRTAFRYITVAGNMLSWLRARRQVPLLSGLTARYNRTSEVVTRKTQPLASVLHLLFPSSSLLLQLFLLLSEHIHPSYFLSAVTALPTSPNVPKVSDAAPNFENECLQLEGWDIFSYFVSVFFFIVVFCFVFVSSSTTTSSCISSLCSSTPFCASFFFHFVFY